MKPTFPVTAFAVAALFAGTVLPAVADQNRGPQGDEEARIVVRRDADEAPAPGRPKAEAAKDRSEAPARAPGPWAEGGRPVDRLLEYVKKNHPDEYERLITLRRENPEAFQQTLRRRFEEASTRFREQGGDPRRTNTWRKAEGGEVPRPPGPDGTEARRAAQPDRADGAKRLNPAADKTERTGQRPAGKHAAADTAMAEQMERVKGLVDEFHRAKSDQKDLLRRRIREQIGQTYELRERDRAGRIRQMEEELSRLKKEIEERRELRDQIIDRKVAEILGEDHTAW